MNLTILSSVVSSCAPSPKKADTEKFVETWNGAMKRMDKVGKHIDGGSQFVAYHGDPQKLLAEIKKAGADFPVTVTVYRNGVVMDSHDKKITGMKIVRKEGESIGGKRLAIANWNEFTGKLDGIGKRTQGGVEYVRFNGDPDKLLAEIKKYAADFPVTVTVLDDGVAIDCHDSLKEMVIIDKRNQ